jgi:ketosteroid isomerase-like protein
VKAGDLESYLTLWSDGFRGWSCGQPHTTTIAEVGNSVRSIRDQKIQLYALTREGAVDFGDVVVTYYQATQRREYPDGHLTGTTSKLTHTWRKFGDVWKIIGGMCGALE